MPTRRELLSGAATLAASAFISTRSARTANQNIDAAGLTPDPYGIIDLLPGYTYRVLFRAGKKMSDGHFRPPDHDLNVLIPRSDGSWYLVTGHEVRGEYGEGVTGSLTRTTLGRNFNVRESRLLTQAMRNNCSGGLTSWGHVLTCEEFPREPFEGYPGEGYIWEVDPETGEKWRRDAMGRFSHESVLEYEGRFYITEDNTPGYLYRFTPAEAGNLAHGKLEAFRAESRSWLPIDAPYHAPQEAKARGATGFARLEGIVLAHNRRLIISETGVATAAPYGRLLRLDPATGALSVLLRSDGPTMANPDNLCFGPDRSLYVCEDKGATVMAKYGDNKVLRMLPGTNHVEVFARLRVGEPSGPVITPDGKRMLLNILAGRDSKTLLIDFPAA